MARPPAFPARGRPSFLAAALCALVSCAGAATPDLDGLVVITLDTTRADRLSPYGYMNVSLPAIERLAAEGVLFDAASSVAPLTLPAHTSLFTGLLPPRHGVRDNADPPLSEEATTLAEVLRGRGFRTAAVVGSVVVAPDRGLAQGFETYLGPDGHGDSPDHRQRRADAVVGDALRWLDQVGDAPFFLWTHLFDPHAPYDPPDPYRATYAHNPYVGEIAFADSQVDRVLAALEQSGRLDRTLVVLAADHGESFGAHGEHGHGIFVYDDVIRVPLIMRVPGVPARRIGSVVRLVDVMPTALDWLGIDVPPSEGVSLRSLMTGEVSSLDLDAYAESLYPERFGWSGLRAISDGRFKLIDAPRPELYDLERDPFEEENIHALRVSAVRAMDARLADVAAGRTPWASDPSPPSPEQRERLAALGYLGAPVRRAPPGGRRGPDPKDCIGLLAAAGAPPPAAAGACR